MKFKVTVKRIFSLKVLGVPTIQAESEVRSTQTEI
jgi:hypothetical protein